MLAAVVALAVLWTVATALGAGFFLRVGIVRVSSNDPVRALVVALLAAGAYVAVFGWRRLRQDLESLTHIPARAATLAAIAAAAATLFVGLRYGTWLAGGSDSYGYVSQADLWLRGSLRVAQPWAAAFDWPFADWVFSPLGYRPGTVPHTIVPTYASGLPILMAIAKVITGTPGPYLVAPLVGALGVWWTFLLGKRLAGPAEGAIAGALLATSPAVLMNLVFPMSDIPAMAFWTLALLLGLSVRRSAPLLAGLAASMAVLIRPNLAPVAAVVLLAVAVRRRRAGQRSRDAVRDIVLFAAGAAPGVCAVAALNAYLYGSPLQSGYGSLRDVYDPARSWLNLKRWAEWLWSTQPAVAVLAPIGLLLPGALAARRGATGTEPRVPGRLLLCSLIAVVMACYLFYLPFDAWWFLRFLFPMFPALLILAAAGLTGIAGRLPQGWRVPVAAIFVVAIVSAQARTSANRGAFEQYRGTIDTLSAARALERLVPENAMIICMQESGTLRYYAHRLTLRYDWLPPEWLDRAVEDLQAKGYRPYIFLEDWEVPVFRASFSSSRAGRLAEKPFAVFPPSRALYDPLSADNRAPPPPR